MHLLLNLPQRPCSLCCKLFLCCLWAVVPLSRFFAVFSHTPPKPYRCVHTHHFVNEVGTRLLAALLLLSPLFLSQSLAVCDLSLKTCCGRCCVCSCLPAAFAGTSRPQCSLALTQGTVDKQESEDEKKEKKKGTIKKKRKR